jgi:hypothetical protein
LVDRYSTSYHFADLAVRRIALGEKGGAAIKDDTAGKDAWQQKKQPGEPGKPARAVLNATAQ